MISFVGTTKEIMQFLWEQEKEKKFKLEEYHDKRSLSQNAYCWKLITEIGNVIRLSKEEVYLNMLKSYGQFEVVSILSSINPKGYLKYYEEIGTGEVNGKEFTHYKVYKGSSEFDTKEMTIFIDGIIQECNNLGIPTLTPEEIKKWRLV